MFWGFSITFMAIDWILSVNPQWFSTIFGLLFIAGQGLTSMAFLITLMVLLSSRRPMSEILTQRHLHDLGKFLLALVMVWAYFSYSQFLIIWAGNLPEEIPWYLARLNHGWQYVALALVVGHFALPFALLLSRDIKRNYKLLRGIAIFILFMRLVDLYWVVAPEFRKESLGVSWMDFAAPLGLTGIWLRTSLCNWKSGHCCRSAISIWRRLWNMEENKPLIGGHESADIDVWAVGKVGIVLAVVCVVTLGLIWGFFVFLREEGPTEAKAVNPLEIFPKPQLEQRPVQELRVIRDAENEQLASYGWVDQSGGVVRIPIDRAIDLLSQRGLPARKQAPPVSEIAAPTESGLGAK